jgi:hypothetical protein
MILNKFVRVCAVADSLQWHCLDGLHNHRDRTGDSRFHGRCAKWKSYALRLDIKFRPPLWRPSSLTLWPESASGLYQPENLEPTVADRRCHVVRVTDPYGRILGFLYRSRYFFFQVAPQLYSRGWVDPAPDPLLLRKFGSAGNRTWDLWASSQEFWPLDHRGGLLSST